MKWNDEFVSQPMNIDERFDRIPGLALRYLYDSTFPRNKQEGPRKRERTTLINNQNKFVRQFSIERFDRSKLLSLSRLNSTFRLSLSLSQSSQKSFRSLTRKRLAHAKVKTGDTRDSRVYLPRISRTSVRDTRLAVTVSLSIKLIGMYNAHLNSYMPRGLIIFMV